MKRLWSGCGHGNGGDGHKRRGSGWVGGCVQAFMLVASQKQDGLQLSSTMKESDTTWRVCTDHDRSDNANPRKNSHQQSFAAAVGMEGEEDNQRGQHSPLASNAF